MCPDEDRRERGWQRSGLPGAYWRESLGVPWGWASPLVAPATDLLGAGSLLALRFLALALDAGLLVVLASASLRQNATLLDLLVEASQRTLEGLVFAYADFSQSGIPSRRRDYKPHRVSGAGDPRGIGAAW